MQIFLLKYSSPFDRQSFNKKLATLTADYIIFCASKRYWMKGMVTYEKQLRVEDNFFCEFGMRCQGTV